MSCCHIHTSRRNEKKLMRMCLDCCTRTLDDPENVNRACNDTGGRKLKILSKLSLEGTIGFFTRDKSTSARHWCWRGPTVGQSRSKVHRLSGVQAECACWRADVLVFVSQHFPMPGHFQRFWLAPGVGGNRRCPGNGSYWGVCVTDDRH